MTSKNLRIKEEIYRKLMDAKKGNESFSEVIERLLQGKNDLMSFAGILSNDKKFAEAVREDIVEVRRLTVIRNDSD
jgi:predicted CopG family antitoxin